LQRATRAIIRSAFICVLKLTFASQHPHTLSHTQQQQQQQQRERKSHNKKHWHWGFVRCHRNIKKENSFNEAWLGIKPERKTQPKFGSNEKICFFLFDTCAVRRQAGMLLTSEILNGEHA
jgi:hypothetical protein